jgi:hypothetical protein
VRLNFRSDFRAPADRKNLPLGALNSMKNLDFAALVASRAIKAPQLRRAISSCRAKTRHPARGEEKR